MTTWSIIELKKVPHFPDELSSMYLDQTEGDNCLVQIRRMHHQAINLTQLPLDKMAAISQTIFWDAFAR